MKTLITGADGFIGSHLVEQCIERGDEVRALVKYNSLNSWGWLEHLAVKPPANLEVVAGDIRDPQLCSDIVRGCDRVLHLAALISIPYSYTAPDSYIDTNIRGTLNLLLAARSVGVKRFVQTSTSEVYGTAQYVPIDEHHPLNAQSPYAASKIAADQLSLSFFASFGVPVVIARPFNTYGPRQSARAVIPTIITQLIKGSTLHLGALHPTRDFCFVEDTVSAFLAIADSTDGAGETFNFGSGHEVSIFDLAHEIADIIGRAPSFGLESARVRPASSEVGRLCAKVDKMKNTFGWEAEYSGTSGLERGLRKTIAWFSDQANFARYKVARYNI